MSSRPSVTPVFRWCGAFGSFAVSLLRIGFPSSHRSSNHLRPKSRFRRSDSSYGVAAHYPNQFIAGATKQWHFLCTIYT